MDTFTQPELMIRLTVSRICLQNDNVQYFDARWDQLLSGTSDVPPENVQEGLYKNKLQCAEQLQTVFAMYNQELNRYPAAPNYQKLRKVVRQHIDQTIRTRNLKARNERIETGVLVKSLEEMPPQKEKWEIAISGRQMDSVRKEIPVF